MQIKIGSLFDGKARGADVIWNPEQLINGHLIMTGDSGSGKTHNLRSFCTQIAATAGPGLERIHIIDPHEDIAVDGDFVIFSQSTSYAFNPLEVSPDPHFGGVNRAINNFIGLLQRSSRKLGPQQESVLRTIMLDVYQQRGYNADNPDTWTVQDDVQNERITPGRVYLEVPYEERVVARETARAAGLDMFFDGEVKCWWVKEHVEALHRWPLKQWGRQAPTLHDVIAHAEFKLKQVFTGTDAKGLLALENYCRQQAGYISRLRNMRKKMSTEDEEKVRADVAKAGDRAKDAIYNFIDKIETGQELDSLIRYESADVLKSLLDRLKNLRATGVCRSVPPPYSPNELVWRYGLRAYADDEKRMFVENLLERILQKAITRGEVNHITDVVVIDEAPKFMVDDHDHIICKIVNEARKFGVALFLVAQSPTHYPEQILAGVGCKVILGLDPMYHRMASSKLALEQRYIEHIQPRKLVLVNQKLRGSVARWMPVLL